MMTPAQSRMARAAIGWTTTELAKAAKVGISTVNRFETDQAVPIPATLAAIQRALEDAGIVFLGDGETTDGGPGVRLKKGR
jgi:transcriptional regulator with XRE-family HTH domain